MQTGYRDRKIRRRIILMILRLVPIRPQCLRLGLLLERGKGVAGIPNPTVKRKRLGIELRRLREEAGLTCEQVGERLDCSGTRISRIETGRISAGPGDVRELLDVYDIEGEEAASEEGASEEPAAESDES